MSTTYAGSFNGSSSTLSSADADLELSGGSFWFMAWVNTNSMSNTQNIINRDDTGGNRQYGLWLVSGAIYVEVLGTTNCSVTDSNTLSAGWNLCVGWYDVSDSKGRTSLNAMTATVSSGTATPTTVTVATQIGERSGSFFFDGLLDGIAIGKGYAPTPTDLTWLYNGGSGRKFSDWAAGVPSLHTSTIRYLTFSNASDLGEDSLGHTSFTNTSVTQSSSGIVDPVGAPPSAPPSKFGLLGVG